MFYSRTITKFHLKIYINVLGFWNHVGVNYMYIQTPNVYYYYYKS
jgi:hypothetical protein